MRYGSVCSGVEAASLAWMPLGWECKFVAEVEPFPCAVLQERFGATAPIHPLDPAEATSEADRKMREAWMKQNALLKKEGKIPNEGDFTKIGKKYAGQIDLLVGGTPCFAAGTMVLTPSGYVPIETLKVGDAVISGEGVERKVEAVGNKLADIGSLKIIGRPEIFCTDNHPFMCIDVKRDNRRKSPTFSQYIPVNDYYKVPAAEAVGKYVGRVKVAPVVAPVLPEVYDATAEQIIELAGWYLGDGYIRRWSGSNKKAVIFALCNQQKIDTFNERFGDALNYSIGNDGKITVACTAFANWLSEWFGELSENKHIPYWCYAEEYKYALLCGYRNTDGCEQEKEYKFSTVSKALAYGMADLMGDASVTFTETPDTTVIDGRVVNQKDYYCVHFYKKTTIKTKKFNGRYASKIRNFVYAGIGTVYNITVAEDHTYIANGIYVHNCQDLSVAGKRAGFDGERSSLAIDFVRLAYESQCKWFVWENVPGVFSSNNGRDFATLLSLFTGCEIGVPKDGWSSAGFVCNARRDRFGVAWRVLDAQFTRTPNFPFAIPQRRRRVFVVGHFGDWSRAAEVLLESNGLPWNTPARIKTRQRVTGNAETDIGTASGTLQGAESDGGKSVSGVTSVSETGKGFYKEQPIAQTIEAHEDQHRRNIIATSIGNGQFAGLVNEPEIAQTLNCMHDQQAILCRATQQGNAEVMSDACPTLTEAAGTSGNNQPIICLNDQGGSVMAVEDNGIAGTLRANTHGNEQIVCGDLVQTLKIRSGKEGGGKGALIQNDLSATLGCGNDQTLFVVHGAQTPINNSEHANALGCCNDGLENCVCQKVPQIISLNKQLGECEDDLATTILSTDYKEPQIVCYENHANDSRVRDMGDSCQTLNSRMGTGGGNLPIVQECYSVDRRNQTLDSEVSNTLNAVNGGDNYNTVMQECYALDSMSSNSMKSQNPNSGFHKEEIAKTLDTSNCDPAKNQGGNVIVSSINCQGGQNINVNNDVTDTLTAATNSSGNNLCGVCCEAVAIAENIIGRKVENGGNGIGAQEELAYTQNASGVMGVCTKGNENEKEIVYGDAEEKRAYEVLLTLWQKINASAFCEWAFGRLGGFQKAEILRQNLHGKSVRCEAGERKSLLDDSSLSCEKADYKNSLFTLWEKFQSGCSPSGLELAEQFVEQLNLSLQRMSYQSSPKIASTVRRLLPICCERLMGFPDNHTKIAFRGQPADKCPDSPRYKACGNSMCVNVMEWIGRQIDKIEKER